MSRVRPDTGDPASYAAVRSTRVDASQAPADCLFDFIRVEAIGTTRGSSLTANAVQRRVQNAKGGCPLDAALLEMRGPRPQSGQDNPIAEPLRRRQFGLRGVEKLHTSAGPGELGRSFKIRKVDSLPMANRPDSFAGMASLTGMLENVGEETRLIVFWRCLCADRRPRLRGDGPAGGRMCVC